MKKAPRFQKQTLIPAVVALLFFPSCGGVPKVHPPVNEEYGVSRVTEVMAVATRDVIKKCDAYDFLIASGIPDADLHDGSLGAGRVYCCGGPNEQGNAMWFYIPDGMKVEVGNIVEVSMGRQAGKGDRGEVNRAIRIRHEHLAQSPCRWVPEDERLWMRILHCDWMENEGWVEKGGLWKTWFKPAH